MTWAQCTLRHWLKDKFLDSLGDPLVSQIVQLKVPNGPNPIWGTHGGQDTWNRVFLLSMKEAAWLVAGRRNVPWKEYEETRRSFTTPELVARNEAGAPAWWWLRSPGFGADFAANVSASGDLQGSGGRVTAASGGVRPAFWLAIPER